MVLFFGPPGSGKSVQGQLLVERNNWRWVSTGDLFRNTKDTEILRRMADGELIDDELTSRILSEELQQIDPKVNVVLDGYPRNLDQVEWLEEHLSDYGRTMDCIVFLDVPDEVLVERLAGRGRTEDTVEVINHRLDIYREKTAPVLEFYREHGRNVCVIDGTGEVATIHERVQEAVASCLKTK